MREQAITDTWEGEDGRTHSYADECQPPHLMPVGVARSDFGDGLTTNTYTGRTEVCPHGQTPWDDCNECVFDAADRAVAALGAKVDAAEAALAQDAWVEQQPVLSLADIDAIMRRASYAKSRIAEQEDTAKRDHELIDRCLLDETAADRRLIADAEAQCEAFMRRRLELIDSGELAGANRSVNRPWGRIETRTRKPEPTVADAEALKEWAIAHPEWLRKVTPPEPAPDWARIKRGVMANPAWLDERQGVEWTEPRTDVSVVIGTGDGS